MRHSNSGGRCALPAALLATALAVVQPGLAGTAGAQTIFHDASDRLPPAAAATMDAVAADLDGDGMHDLVLAQEWIPSRILMNQGGFFSDASGLLPVVPRDELRHRGSIGPFMPGKDAEDVAVVDLNRDGRLDVVIVAEDDVRLARTQVHQYLLAVGDGRFERIYGELPDTIANAVAHADVTGDGAADLLLSGEGQDRLLINDGQGGFRDETLLRLPAEGRLAHDAAFGDIDGDGDADIILALDGGHALWVNVGGGGFVDETSRRLPPRGDIEARRVAVADVDGDGDLDLYFSHMGWNGRDGRDALLFNDGQGVFREPAGALPEDSASTLAAEFLDFDDDGDLDLALAKFDAVVLLRNHNGTFTSVEGADGVLLAPGMNMVIVSLDADGDGRLDLFVGQRPRSSSRSPARDRLFLRTAH